MSDKIGIAIVGAGYWGPNLIRNFSNLNDCNIRWVCEKKTGRLHYISQNWPHIQLTSEYDDLIKDTSVDAIIIATPVSTHFHLGLSALKAGKHVFIEKPLTTNSKDAEILIELTEQKKLIIASGHIFVYHPAVSAMKQSIIKGDLGNLCYAESGRVNLGPPASEVNVIWDLAVHDISILLYLWGKNPIEVRAYGQNFLHSRLIDVAFIFLRFDDESIAHHHVSWMSPDKVRRFFIAGTNGSLVFNDTIANDKLRIIDKGIDSRINLKDDENKELFYKSGKISYPKLSNDEPLLIECKHFLKCISNGSSPRADGAAGLSVVRILEAAEQSIKLGSKPVRLESTLNHF